MTSAVAAPSARSARLATLAAALRRPGLDAPTYTGLAVLMVLATAPTLVAMALDPRMVEGVSLWVKPLKFEIALALYAATLAVYARFVPPRVRASLPHRLFVGLVALAFLYEMIWIAGAAAFGVPSHFNLTTPLMEHAYRLAGIGAVTLTAASLVTGIAIAVNRETGLAPALKLSLVAGLLLTFVATVVVAGYLAGQGGHYVGGEGAPAGTWPVFGWATDRGDLRVAHFLATHALHVLPLVGLLVVALRGPSGGTKTIAAASLCYAALVAYAFLEAIAGRAFLSTLAG